MLPLEYREPFSPSSRVSPVARIVLLYQPRAIGKEGNVQSQLKSTEVVELESPRAMEKLVVRDSQATFPPNCDPDHLTQRARELKVGLKVDDVSLGRPHRPRLSVAHPIDTARCPVSRY